MVRLYVIAFFVAISSGSLACGDDGGGGSIDAATADAAAVDAPGSADANPNELCQQLCECATTVCSAQMNACLSECAQVPASVRTCRNTHCGYAQSNATVHCPHVAGDPLAQGTPPECIFDLGIDAGPTPDALTDDADTGDAN